MAQQWEPGAQVVRLMGDVENLVWQVQGQQDFVLRMTVPSHRSQTALKAELDWLSLMIEAGLPVCRPCQSPQGHWLETWKWKSSEFWVCRFAWISGETLETPKDWNQQRVRNLGSLAAQLHLNAASLASSVVYARPDWSDGPHLQDPEHMLDLSKVADQQILAGFQLCKTSLANLPQTIEHFGLIHGDMHRGNLMFQGDQPVLFDFDDCHRGWFAQDLALILYYAIPSDMQITSDFTDWFLSELQAGYVQIRPWPELFENTLDHFLRWRDLQLYLFLLCRWPSGRPAKAQTSLERLKNRICNGKTLLNP